VYIVLEDGTEVIGGTRKLNCIDYDELLKFCKKTYNLPVFIPLILKVEDIVHCDFDLCMVSTW
jgi:hypothetical protein